MINKQNIGAIAISLGILITPLTTLAAVNSSLNTSGAYTTGTDSQIDVTLSNYSGSTDVSVFTLSDSSINDIKSASFLDKSGWVKLTPYQSGSDVLAKFISDTGFTVNGQRVITMRLNLKTPKTYIVGFSLVSADGKTLSSAASPMTVTGPVVKGVSTTVTYTRQLRVGISGADVKNLQYKLASEGFFSGPYTGYFGKLTLAAVKAYQTAHGIYPANGVVGPATLAVLNQ